jgi:FixJ family two-component response regulator
MPDREIVYVVDDDLPFRRSTERVIRASGHEVQGFASAEEFLSARLSDVCCCIVLDVRMPGLSGLELQQVLKEEGRSAELVFISGHSDVPTSVSAMKGGAVDFLTKPFHDADLIHAIEQALERDREARRVRADIADLRERWAALTKRERQVMKRVVRGLLNKQIAAELGVSETTVKVHRHNLTTKLNAPSIAALVKMAERLGIPTA